MELIRREGEIFGGFQMPNFGRYLNPFLIFIFIFFFFCLNLLHVAFLFFFIFFFI